MVGESFEGRLKFTLNGLAGIVLRNLTDCLTIHVEMIGQMKRIVTKAVHVAIKLSPLVLYDI